MATCWRPSSTSVTDTPRRLLFAALATLALLGVVWGLWAYSGHRSSQLFGELVQRVDTPHKLVALTFDDGPMPGATERILSLLDEHRVPATFFVVGEAVAQHPQQARAIVAAGHELGNHSWSHQRMVLKSPAWVAEELERTDQAIRAAGMTGLVHFRPPYGKKLLVLPWVLRGRGQTSIMWDIEPESYGEVRRDPQAIADHVLERAQPGSIILLHVMFSAREASVQAVPRIIEGLQERGYRFVTVSELLEQWPG